MISETHVVALLAVPARNIVLRGSGSRSITSLLASRRFIKLIGAAAIRVYLKHRINQNPTCDQLISCAIFLPDSTNSLSGWYFFKQGL